MLKIGVIGAGNRVRKFYQDILCHLHEQNAIQVVGIVNRSLENTAEFQATFSCPAYSDLTTFLTTETPDALIVAIPPTAKDALIPQLIKKKIHLFLESPASEYPHLAATYAKLARQHHVQIEVGEDYAINPEAIAQKVESPDLVINQFDGYYYHAIARLRTLLPKGDCVKKYSGFNQKIDGGTLQCRTLQFKSNSIYQHTFLSPKTAIQPELKKWIAIGKKTGTSSQIKFACPENWSGQKKGLFKLVERFVHVLNNEKKDLLYGIDLAAKDGLIWRTMELCAKLPISSNLPAWLLEYLTSWIYRVAYKRSE